ncbi:hypothetical protein PSTG_14200 [Puccinia striiformis f. sp. tritici PST-78]|uniref:Uncharacterized protein n=1 Tax=Puccinia striiformis f. sp. tritici PST-78 TaxID=1165861 RepID=A0A0L0V028_9BASI|nr:hypothetical protein PSTG_14200 [Puccinia striiformis f. sp. tritici PST-78]
MDIQSDCMEFALPVISPEMTGLDSEERNAQPLVWHAKSKLYSHSVELHAERQPLYRGTHIGTTISTRILAAIDRRKRPILSSLKKFNGYRNDYLTKFAPEQLNLPENQPLTHHTFTNLSLDSTFWQDVYLFHSQAPWARNADVRAGIQAVLSIDRSQEEKVIVSQEFKSALSWAVELHASILSRLDEIDQQILALEEEVDGNAGLDSDFNMRPPNGFQSITSVNLGECEEINKLVLVQSVLQEELSKHRSLMRRWAGDVLDLWQTLYGPDSPDHLWFSLISSLPSPSVYVTETENGDSESINILDEEDSSSDVDGEEINATEMMNLLNIANND